MTSRLDRALDLLERLVAAAERSADALEQECELSDEDEGSEG